MIIGQSMKMEFNFFFLNFYLKRKRNSTHFFTRSLRIEPMNQFCIQTNGNMKKDLRQKWQQSAAKQKQKP